MSQYSLIEENWIPVKLLDGNYKEYGIKETLLKAKEIAVIEDSSPLIVASLYRFLLAVLYRAVEGPTDIEQAKKLFREGLPADKISAYLEKWKDRFWLFDEKYPFFQLPNYNPQDGWRSWAAIAAEHNADNAKVLFDHLDVNDSGIICSAKAAQWLVACQTFALGGGNSEFKYTKTAPSATGAIVVPMGRDLHDTLIYSFIPENKDILTNDIPVWERIPDSVDSLTNGVSKPIKGYADLYTWRTRSIKLNSGDNGQTVRGLAFASGVESSLENILDPMFAYRVDEKKGKLPIHFRERGLWRDYDSLMPDAEGLGPQVIQNAIQMKRADQSRSLYSVMVYGQANNKAKIEFWRMERFMLPNTIAENSVIKSEIRNLLDVAEDAQKSLYGACKQYAQSIIAKGNRKPDSKDVSAFIKQMNAISWYWSNLEPKFHEALTQYSKESDFDKILCNWIKSVVKILSDAWEFQKKQTKSGDAWTIRASIRAEKPVLEKLKELKDKIAQLER